MMQKGSKNWKKQRHRKEERKKWEKNEETAKRKKNWNEKQKSASENACTKYTTGECDAKILNFLIKY